MNRTNKERILDYLWSVSPDCATNGQIREKTGAPTAFLVFGNDRQVPSLWLERYGHLVGNVAFYFLTDEGELELLTEKANQ